jgi:plastocyanin
VPRNRRSLVHAAAAAAAAAVGGGRLAARVAAAAPAYRPQTRRLPIVMVPVLTHEFAGFLDYLTPDFATGGMLAGKEVFAFLPNHLAAYAGDTLEFTCYNPADDRHTLTFPDLNQSADVPGGTSGTLTLTDLAPGIYRFHCTVAEHEPFMWGQLVVLPAPA